MFIARDLNIFNENKIATITAFILGEKGKKNKAKKAKHKKKEKKKKKIKMCFRFFFNEIVFLSKFIFGDDLN